MGCNEVTRLIRMKGGGGNEERTDGTGYDNTLGVDGPGLTRGSALCSPDSLISINLQ